jgi:hypothetical protein
MLRKSLAKFCELIEKIPVQVIPILQILFHKSFVEDQHACDSFT